jgi:hypothetical protein
MRRNPEHQRRNPEHQHAMCDGCRQAFVPSQLFGDGMGCFFCVLCIDRKTASRQKLSRLNNPRAKYLKPSSKSWPVNDVRHAKIALQYMARGFGNRKEYPTLLANLANLYPRSAYPDVWVIYDRNHAKILKNPREVTLYRVGSYLGAGTFWAESPDIASKYGKGRTMHTVVVPITSRVALLDTDEDIERTLINFGIDAATAEDHVMMNDWMEGYCGKVLARHYDWVRRRIEDSNHFEWVRLT